MKTRLFFVIGAEFSHRKRAIDGIKARLLKKKESSLNTRVFYAKEINLSNLRDVLFSFSFDRDKVIIFKESQNLDVKVKDFIYSNIKNILDANYLIFELEKDFFYVKNDRRFNKDKFFSFLLNNASLYRMNSFNEDISIKKLLSFIRKNNLNESLYILEKIFSSSQKAKDFVGMQILGALTREFSYTNNPLKRQKCFDLIWGADRALKQGRLGQKAAIQLLITKLLL